MPKSNYGVLKWLSRKVLPDLSHCLPYGISTMKKDTPCLPAWKKGTAIPSFNVCIRPAFQNSCPRPSHSLIRWLWHELIFHNNGNGKNSCLNRNSAATDFEWLRPTLARRGGNFAMRSAAAVRWSETFAWLDSEGQENARESLKCHEIKRHSRQ